MAKRSAAIAASAPVGDPALPFDAEILDLDGVAERRERFLAAASAASQVVTYEFAISPGATVQGLGAAGLRDAAAQLELVVALTGGAWAKFPGGRSARVPVAATERFETLAKPLIEAFLVGWRI